MPKNKNSLFFEIASSIKSISEEDWNKLFGEDIVEGYGYHKTLEESQLKEFSFRYLLARRQNKLAAIIPFAVNDFSFTTLIQGKLQKIILNIQKKFPSFLRLKMLFVSFPTCEEFYLGISTQENLSGLLDQALNYLQQFCRAENISAILFYNLTQKHQALRDYLKQKGFAVMKSFPNAAIEIKADSFKEYLDGLGRSTRKNIRKCLKESQEIVNLRTEITEDISRVSKRVFELYLNNFDESDVRFEVLTRDFFLNITANMPGIAKYFLTYDQEKLVAFNLLLIKGEAAIDKFIGMDKEVSHKYHLYYTTFSHNIEYCIKNKIRSYIMGVTDYEPKIRLGAKIFPLYVYAKLQNPFFNLFCGLITALASPQIFDPDLKNIKY